ncbi:putative Non-specific lipid-transfer protein 2 [Cocos nucifera]|uniref:Putative Non-specific lipid-transfer protein 2 n=1 Tax=Cocos nucifera TaxID=13894 RepID=A0A8K0HYU3_COCNU|nr:putative Non-specific lipid-transfer protein 2 [Cocos nucifera]
MGISIPVVAVILFIDLFAFVLAVGAEMRRNTGRVVPDEYDERTYCQYDSDASTAYGLGAVGMLLVTQAVVSGVTRCLCFGRGLTPGNPGPLVDCSSIWGYVLMLGWFHAIAEIGNAKMHLWLSFVVAEACLVAGSARNAYHTKYLGYHAKHDLTSCAALRKGVFAAAAALVLLSMVMSLLFYWSYSRADTGGWVKHQNEGGVGMAEHGPNRGELGGHKA